MSRLEEINKIFREAQVNKNTYGFNDEYRSEHPNALSDGDEFGKGENSGQVGNSTDIRMRKSLMAKNKYSFNNEYNQGNA